EELARRGHEEALGHGDGHLVIRVAHVELAVAHVGLGHPAAYVVVDGELRVPVSEVEHLAVLAHSGGTGLGNLEAPGELELAPPAGGNGVCEPDLHHGVGDGVARPTSLLDEWLAA